MVQLTILRVFYKGDYYDLHLEKGLSNEEEQELKNLSRQDDEWGTAANVLTWLANKGHRIYDTLTIPINL